MPFYMTPDLPKDKIFVFGSNLRGVHGRGAAQTAAFVYGARPGAGAGPTGRAYAIPTKDWNIRTLPLQRIRKYVLDFLSYAKANPTLEFYVTPVGTGLAGYTAEEIAPMFQELPNCWYPKEWEQLLSRQ